MAIRFHRPLKTSLSVADDAENWMDNLSRVLLDIRSSLKSDLDCSAAEHAFGAIVRLPGKMISPTPRSAIEDPNSLLHRLRQFVRTRSPDPFWPSVSEFYLEKDLTTFSHILRCDRVFRPVEPPYGGLFQVASRGANTFRIKRGIREEVVSFDGLKAVVPGTPPNASCAFLPFNPPSRPFILPFHILALPSCPLLPTVTTPSPTPNA
nr:unnamed protein product [Spirometra erinaceieuropaei]